MGNNYGSGIVFTNKCAKDPICIVQRTANRIQQDQNIKTEYQMSRITRIVERFPDCEFLTIDGCDKAIIGIDFSVDPCRLVYSANKIVDCFVKQGMHPDEAIEHFEYNVQRSIPYYPNSPLIIHTDF